MPISIWESYSVREGGMEPWNEQEDVACYDTTLRPSMHMFSVRLLPWKVPLVWRTYRGSRAFSTTYLNNGGGRWMEGAIIPRRILWSMLSGQRNTSWHEGHLCSCSWLVDMAPAHSLHITECPQGTKYLKLNTFGSYLRGMFLSTVSSFSLFNFLLVFSPY